jgi:peptidyl-dipeptidase Dcp
MPPSTTNNPLLEPWSGPHGGVPPFARTKVSDFAPALDAAMDEMRREITAIADNPAPPTWQNTVYALEDAGRTLNAVQTVYGVWSSAMSSPEFQALEQAMAPKLAAFEDEIAQNEKIYARIVRGAAEGPVSSEGKRLAWRTEMRLARAGAKLGPEAKRELTGINQRLASLFTTFAQNILADEDKALVLDHESDLDGLPEPVRAGAAAAAAARGMPGKWAIVNTRSAFEPFLTYATRADLREKVWRAYVSRGDGGGEHDNKGIITEILRLRAERARLLGYPTHAHYRLEDSMAKTPERALELMESVWGPAVARVREEVADMEAIAGRKIRPWDYRFYAEKVRKQHFDLDESELTPYLELDSLREGMFWVAEQLYDLRFEPAPGLPVYHPDVRVWSVRDRKTGRAVGLWYFDPYARPGKHSGAWMSAYRVQEKRPQGDVTPIVSNNANFVKPREGEPTLVSYTDATTLFHEFGHAIHGLCSNVTFPSLSGPCVARDFVEFPSQLFEHWLSTPEVLGRFAVHHETREPMPAALVEKIERAKTFNQGFATVEYLSAALVDMKLHLAGSEPIDPAAFERDTLAALGMPEEIVMRHRIPQFSHVFASDAYSAAYYSYLWADALTADAWAAFTEAGGPFDRAVAERLRTHVLSVGDTIDPADAYRAFRGRDVDTRALMRKRGLLPTSPAA